MPRRGGPIQKRPIPHVKKVLAVASGKGGVGKSTIAGAFTPIFLLIRQFTRAPYSQSCIFSRDAKASIPWTTHMCWRAGLGYIWAVCTDTHGSPTHGRAALVVKCVPKLLIHILINRIARFVFSGCDSSRHKPWLADHVHGLSPAQVWTRCVARRCHSGLAWVDGTEGGTAVTV